MCGIAGIWGSNHQSAQNLQEVVRRMQEALLHRGPDHGDVWVDEKNALALAHRRLSILDLSAEGHQPKFSRSNRYVIVYNGEIYNHNELRAPLKAAGHKFKGESDTETLLAAIDEWGVEESIQKINGMFAFALWDMQEQVLHFVRDRFGKKPLYVGWVGNNLLFASELKAIRTHPDMKPELDKRALKAYLRFGYIPAPHCIYSGFISLPPGTMISMNKTSLAAKARLNSLVQPYWNAVQEAVRGRREEPISDETEAIAQVGAVLQDAVKSRLISDVPLGSFLSGGIDSTVVTALMQSQLGKRVNSYAIGFDQQGYDEAPYARQIAYHLGTDHHEMYVTAHEAREFIPKLPEIYDEPFADISQIPTYFISKFAKQDVTVALSGDGGDELFGGYNRHLFGPAMWQKMQWMPPKVRCLLGSIMMRMGTDFWQRLKPGSPQFGDRVMKVARSFAAKNRDDLYLSFLSLWDDPENLMQASTRKSCLGLLDEPEYSQDKGLRFADRMLAYDTLHYLPNDVLAKVDRASMANSMEVRAPLLDYRLYQLAWRLDPKMRIRGRNGKWILKQILYRYVPRAMVDRPKMGFTLPVGEWLRGPLKKWASAMLDPSLMREQGYLYPAPVQQIWREHLSGRVNHGYRLWTILMFQAWLDRWM